MFTRNLLSDYLSTLALALTLGCTLHTDDDDDSLAEGDAGDNAARIASTCEAYCAKGHDCEDSLDADECADECEELIGGCMDDEQLTTMDDLEACARTSCDEFAECTVGAGLQCSFGI
jgi:hypothetical protein